MNAECVMSEIIDWLRKESAEQLRSSLARKSSADATRDATVAELRASKRMAEGMFGRKLDLVSTTVEDNKQYVAMQDRIGEKLHLRAAQLAGWADYLSELMEKPVLNSTP